MASRPDSKDDIKPWNRIYICDVLETINPFLCIKCTGRKERPGVNTICHDCEVFFSHTANDDERFLFFVSLKILNFYLWVRQKILSDNYWVAEDSDGTYVAHQLGVPGDKQHLPVVLAVRIPDSSGFIGPLKLLSIEEQALFEQVLLTSMQCDNALALLADVMQAELLKGACFTNIISTTVPNKCLDGSPVSKVEEIWYEANHRHTSTHCCYRVTLRDERQFAVALTDKQLGWPHIVRDWKEYVNERFHPWEERDAIFFVNNPNVRNEDEEEVEYDVDCENVRCWTERGLRVGNIGCVLTGQREEYYPHGGKSPGHKLGWHRMDMKRWANHLPPYDMLRENIPIGWRPELELDNDVKLRQQKEFGVYLEADNGGVQSLWKLWEKETASDGNSSAPLPPAKGKKRKTTDTEASASPVG
jgi:hypothetical protein